MKFTEEQAEAEIKKHIEKVVADSKFDTDEGKVLVLRKFLTVSAESICAINGKQNAVAVLGVFDANDVRLETLNQVIDLLVKRCPTERSFFDTYRSALERVQEMRECFEEDLAKLREESPQGKKSYIEVSPPNSANTESPKKLYAAHRDCEAWLHTELNDAVFDYVDGIYDELLNGDIITVYEGDLVSPRASRFIPDLAEIMLDQAFDTHGEVVESWDLSSYSDGLQNAVKSCVDKWADNNEAHPGFGEVANIRPIKIKLVNLDEGTPEWCLA